ncbi:MAG: PTS sugar transporter subunit IIA [Peptoniphilaceae bacterium]|nr:PTS sugar transporter subunit IIA [Peptoniphilaceae bacterium]MDY6019224.1 PTS sugar transporter subunit IIA [Anaerococcus sp.]
MLDQIIDRGLYDFYDHIDTWQEAIEKSCKKLIENNIVGENYPKQIIQTVEKYGPYIVLIPGVAMPHCQENCQGVNDTAIAFMKVEKPVSFDENDKDKEASLFFTVASTDSDKHIENISKLSDILCDEEIVESLLEVKNLEDLKKIQEKYNI